MRPVAKNRTDNNHAWGTAVLDPYHDEIFMWSGGHVAYTGNDVLHYSIKSNLFYIGHRPEVALRYGEGQGGMAMSKTYRNRAFMTGHGYHSNAWDSIAKKFIVCGQTRFAVKGKLYFAYDPAIGEWNPGPIPTPFNVDFSGNCLCSTPKGVVAWEGGNIWLLNLSKKKWSRLPHTGAKMPGQARESDNSGMTYDSKRNRLLFFNAGAKGQVTAYDMKTKQVSLLNPEGRGNKAASRSREVVYSPDLDAVLLASSKSFDKVRWLYYDCTKNAWLGLHAAPSSTQWLNEAGWKNLGLMYDPKRKLFWMMTSHSYVYALRIDPKTADLVPLKDLTPASPKKK